jgi:hypothetical protein
MTHAVLSLYLLTLFLLPWGWFPPFPWLHDRAQWSDAVFALTAGLWLIDRLRTRSWPRWGTVHVAMGFYLAAATTSLLMTDGVRTTNAAKLLGIAELFMLAGITSDLVAREGILGRIVRVVAATSIATGVAAILGIAFFYAGVSTHLVGSYGDLVVSQSYARVQAGLFHPNLLANFCIFASALVAHPAGRLQPRVRRLAQGALLVAIGMTFSRGLLGYALAALVRRADTPRRRLFAAAYAAACVAGILFLNVWNLSLDPSHPLGAHFDPQPTPRMVAWTTAVRTLEEHPLSGSGPGNSPAHLRGLPFESHLTPLSVAATLGLPAFVAFAAMLWFLWRDRPRPTDVVLWSGLAGLALDALTEDVEDFRHIWVLMGLAAAWPRRMATSRSAEVAETEGRTMDRKTASG